METTFAAAAPIHRSTLAGISILFAAASCLGVTVAQIHPASRHGAAVVLSIALLGIGASGVAASLYFSRFVGPVHAHRLEPMSLRTLELALFVSSAPFAVAALAALLLEGTAYDPYLAMGRLPLVAMPLGILLAAVPFFFAGVPVALLLARGPGEAGRIQAAQVFGAALGAATSVLARPLLGGPGSLALAVTLGAASMCVLGFPVSRTRVIVLAGVLSALALGVAAARLAGRAGESVAGASGALEEFPAGDPLLRVCLVLSIGLIAALAFISLCRAPRPDGSARTLIYFSTIGLALGGGSHAALDWLEHLLPDGALATVSILSGILASAGAGSLLADRIAHPHPAARTALIAVALLLVILPWLVERLIAGAPSLPSPPRGVVAVLAIVLLAGFMTLPLPLGMRLLEVSPERQVTGAWGVSALFTGIGVVLAGWGGETLGAAAKPAIVATLCLVAAFALPATRTPRTLR